MQSKEVWGMAYYAGQSTTHHHLSLKQTLKGMKFKKRSELKLTTEICCGMEWAWKIWLEKPPRITNRKITIGHTNQCYTKQSWRNRRVFFSAHYKKQHTKAEGTNNIWWMKSGRIPRQHSPCKTHYMLGGCTLVSVLIFLDSVCHFCWVSAWLFSSCI